MKYVLAHFGLVALTAFCAVAASWLVITNTTDSTDYGIAMLGLLVIVLVWIPVVVTALALSDEWGTYRKIRARRRRSSRRRHPSTR